MQGGVVNPGYDNTGLGAPPIASAPMGGGVPGTVVWMPKPEPITGVPPGLEYLAGVNQLMVKQEVEMLEAMTGWETTNKYSIKNTMGQQIYFADEESGGCSRQCCGNSRGFVMHITDNFGKEVMRVIREFKACGGCCWCATSSCCAYEVTVEAPPGVVVGSVRQGCSFWKPRYQVLDAANEVMFDIAGPCCICDCCGDQDFNIFSTQDGEEVGKISKKWTGIVQEIFTKADNFGISFPVNLSVQMKAVLVGAVFLIDFMYFEEDDDDHSGD